MYYPGFAGIMSRKIVRKQAFTILHSYYSTLWVKSQPFSCEKCS